MKTPTEAKVFFFGSFRGGFLATHDEFYDSEPSSRFQWLDTPHFVDEHGMDDDDSFGSSLAVDDHAAFAAWKSRRLLSTQQTLAVHR